MSFTYTVNSLAFIEAELGFGRERRVLCMAFVCLFVGFGVGVFFIQMLHQVSFWQNRSCQVKKKKNILYAEVLWRIPA